MKKRITTGSPKIHQNAIITALLAIIVAFLFKIPFLNLLALGITFYSMALLYQLLGKSIPIKITIFFIASLQWLLGPVFDYAGFSQHYKYYMYVSANEYFPFSIACTLAFFAGLSLIKDYKKELFSQYYLVSIINHINKNPKIPYYLIATGIIASLIQPIVPGSLKFIFFLLGSIKYIGVIYLMFSKDRKKWWVLALVLIFTFLSSLNQAMFHGLILWLMFLGFYFLIVKNYSSVKKLVLLLTGMLFIISIQIVKHEFRQYVWFKGYGGNRVSLFFNLLNETISEENTDEYGEETVPGSATESMVIRINQGWIISRIMDYIPYCEPFLDGESVKEAILATLVPRFLYPYKQKAGGQDYFPRMTGYELTNTSMGASLIGEGYANYGKTGAVLFVFIMGLIYGLALRLLYIMARRYPTLILWIPLLFFQVVKAESDLVRVLNHLVKSGILIAFIYWFSYKILNWKI